MQSTAAPVSPFSPAEGMPVGLNQTTPILIITDDAKVKIRSVLESQDPVIRTIRVAAPSFGKYTMNLEPEGKPGLDDAVLEYDGFSVFVDQGSLARVEGASLRWVDAYGGGGFQFDNPNDGIRPAAPQKQQPPEGPEGEIWRQIQEVLDGEVNPSVAMHGGFIDLMEYREGTVFVQMSGGCQGCGMASVTLKAGVERILRDHFPDIREVLDVTDHAGGNNPYYAPSTK